jgi:hypothetical protein
MITRYQAFAQLVPEPTHASWSVCAWVQPVKTSGEVSLTDAGEQFCSTESDAWAACEASLRKMSDACLRAAVDCRAKREGVAS